MSNLTKKLKLIVFVFGLVLMTAMPVAAATRPVISVALKSSATKKTVSYKQGQKLQINVRKSYKYGKITYTSSDTSVATVSKKGVIRTKTPGKTIITVKAEVKGSSSAASSETAETSETAATTESTESSTEIGKTYVSAKIRLYVKEGNTLCDLANKYAGSDNKYFIRVDKTLHKVYIIKKKYGEWVEYKKFSCCVGAPSTPTPSGIFHLNGKGLNFVTETGSLCWYFSRITGHYLFHSQIYAYGSTPSRIVDGSMGVSCSHGCVRLYLKDAYWIYRYMPNGTTVYIN